MTNPSLTQSWIALVGNPNTGKSALFNVLTGARQKIGNYAGVTVERKHGLLQLPSGHMVGVIDTPGLYHLDPQSLDERVACHVITGHMKGSPVPELIVFVADATHLSLNLRLLIELKELGLLIVVALNMIDTATKLNYRFDIDEMSRLLGLPVVAIAARSSDGIHMLAKAIEDFLPGSTEGKLKHDVVSSRMESLAKTQAEEIKNRYAQIDEILSRCMSRGAPHRLSERLDRILLHRFWGPVILALLFGLVFQSIFSWAAAPQDFIDAMFVKLGGLATQALPDGPLRSLLVDGVIAGVGAVVVFLPQILLLFFFILLLEDSGYMARAAFILDGVMNRAGLSARSVVPFLSSYACAIPGIMSARTIENHRDRLLTIMLSPLMTCSARLPVYTLLISAFVPRREIFGFLELQALVMLALYAIPLVFVFGIASIVKWTIHKNETQSMIMELPNYQFPHWRQLVFGLYEKSKAFLVNAGSIILCAMIVLWFISSYPRAPLDATQPAVYYSLAGQMGLFIEPLLKPLGFDWQVAIALIAGFAQREVVVAALATLYSIGGEGDTLSAGLAHTLSTQWSVATGLSLMTWYIFAPQCISTFAITRRETNSWRWPILMTVYMLLLAYVCALVVFEFTTLLIGG